MQWLLTTLQTLLTFALVFSVLVFFHELGHFSAAKWLKMIVEEFAFGLPIPGTKRLFRYAYDGQTEYTVWPVLAGGFVRIKGMEIEDVPESAVNADPRPPVQWNEAMDETVEKMTGRASEGTEIRRARNRSRRRPGGFWNRKPPKCPGPIPTALITALSAIVLP